MSVFRIPDVGIFSLTISFTQSLASCERYFSAPHFCKCFRNGSTFKVVKLGTVTIRRYFLVDEGKILEEEEALNGIGQLQAVNISGTRFCYVRAVTIVYSMPWFVCLNCLLVKCLLN